MGGDDWPSFSEKQGGVLSKQERIHIIFGIYADNSNLARCITKKRHKRKQKHFFPLFHYGQN